MFRRTMDQQDSVGRLQPRSRLSYVRTAATNRRSLHYPAVAILLLASLTITSSWAAKHRDNLKTACQFKPTLSRSVTRLTGPNSLGLDDGTELVLSGILLPNFLDAKDNLPAWPPAQAAALVVGKSVKLSAVGKRRDRYGRRRAQVFIERNGQDLWLQAYLVGLGRARIDVAELSPACATKLLKLEAEARKARRGLWRHSAYQIRNASRVRDLLRYRGSFQIVEGTVKEVSLRRSQGFINFGKNYRRDFTAGLSGKIARKARIDGKSLEQLKGQTIRVRGWITWRGGPYISVKSVAQIEVIPAQPIAAAPAWKVPTAETPPSNKKRPTGLPSDVFDL